MKNALIWVTLVLAFLSISCAAASEPAPQNQQPAAAPRVSPTNPATGSQPKAEPEAIAQAGSQGESRAEAGADPEATKQAEPEQQAQASQASPDCYDNSDLDKARKRYIKEYDANPFRAAKISQEHHGITACFTAQIAKFRTDREGRWMIQAYIDGGPLFGLRWTTNPRNVYYVDSGIELDRFNRRKNWEDMFINSSVGDKIKVECKIAGISSGEKEGTQKGAPILRDCEWVNDSGTAYGARSASPSAGMETLAWEYDVWSEGDGSPGTAVVSFDVPTGWEWFDPSEVQDNQGEAWIKYAKPKDSNLPLVIVEKDSYVDSLDLAEDSVNMGYRDFDVTSLRTAEGAAGDDPAIFAIYTLHFDGLNEWVASVYPRRHVGEDGDYHAARVRCHTSSEDTMGQAECKAVIDSVRLEVNKQ